MKNYRYLIIGNSAAGIGAAEAIRAVDAVSPMAIVSDESYHTYSRALIAHYHAGKTPFEKMLYRPPDFYDKNHIDAHLGKRVVKVDFGGHSADLSSGETLGWQKLLLATGGRPFIPKMEGLDKKGVSTFLSLDDAKKVEQHLGGAGRVVIVGGGLIGLQAAEALNRRGLDVTVVELLDRVLSPVLDPVGSQIVEQVYRGRGVHILTGCSVQAVVARRNEPDHAGGVLLSTGAEIPADLVIVAIGVVPRTELAANGKVTIDRGMVVDTTMRTSVEDVYAAGDAVEVNDFVLQTRRLIPIWPSAYLGGRTAGFNMAGDKRDFSGITGVNAGDFFGYPIISAGIINPQDGNEYEILCVHDEQNRYYKKLLLKDNIIHGMVLAGDAIDRAGIYYGLMREATSVADFKHRLLGEDPNLMLLSRPLRQAKFVKCK